MAQALSPILIIGSAGMLGRTMMRRLGRRAVGMDVIDCDITQLAQVRRAMDHIRPTTVVNCAAYTAVDQAESEPEQAYAINAAGVENLGRAAVEAGAHLITVSTDYVFNGEGTEPFAEDAPSAAFGPQSVYGKSKLEGEQRLAAVGGRWCIARTQWLYGKASKNFIDTIIRLTGERDQIKVVDDQVGAPTWVEDLAQGIEALIEHQARGYYHVVNSGYASWHTVARYVVDKLGIDCEVIPCGSGEYPLPAKRPHNSRLSQDRFIELTGAPLRPWTSALDAYLAERG